MNKLDIDKAVKNKFGENVGQLFIDSIGEEFPTLDEYKEAKVKDCKLDDFIECLDFKHIEVIITKYHSIDFGSLIRSYIDGELNYNLETDCDFAWSMYDE